MWATFQDVLQEVGGRRMLIIIVGLLPLITGALVNRPFTFGTLNGVDVIFQGKANMGPWPLAVPEVMG